MALIYKETRFLGEDGKMYHFCKECNGYKPADEFNRCSKCPFGLYPLCKEHHRQKNREQYHKTKNNSTRKKYQDDMWHLKLSFPTEEDYILMRKFLEKIGYDTSRNIHEQFMERIKKRNENS